MRGGGGNVPTYSAAPPENLFLCRRSPRAPAGELSTESVVLRGKGRKKDARSAVGWAPPRASFLSKLSLLWTESEKTAVFRQKMASFTFHLVELYRSTGWNLKARFGRVIHGGNHPFEHEA
jgi:hypothetical protein